MPKRFDPKRVISGGEDERLLRTVQMIKDEGIAHPIVTGRTDRIENQCKNHRLGIMHNQDG